MEHSSIELDLKGEVCPLTFVKTKLYMEGLKSGEQLTVIFSSESAASSVPKSVKDEGHTILGIDQEDKDTWKVHIKKA
ncbi:sulfurtransferase TusA family protein [Methanolobus sediminis]|uniref:Sulfurtransferase TusA family protein n=1 Tax=Methanolobus sediminis TaxID=3072978 RepID=A0AA51YM77_9EURY|nr:sulfurtransferase TusA family protein [Methanolobus sediminis]WMW25303.1 sulfurtransferase TusA family protein [Methanolobus sediminis]